MGSMRYALALAILAGVAADSVWSGVYTDAQARRGEGVYAERCASCHGPDLSGIDQAPGLTGGDFTTEWDDLSLNDLFERIRISMPADKPGSLERPQVADVLAFLLQKNNLPAGQTDLPTAAEALKSIKFLAKRP
jgi:polar amino acid transport system substrate-binding protein